MSERMTYNMSVAEQIGELAGLAVEKIVANETSIEESVAPQNSTMSGKEAVPKHQTLKEVLIFFDCNFRYKKSVTSKVLCISLFL